MQRPAGAPSVENMATGLFPAFSYHRSLIYPPPPPHHTSSVLNNAKHWTTSGTTDPRTAQLVQLSLTLPAKAWSRTAHNGHPVHTGWRMSDKSVVLMHVDAGWRTRLMWCQPYGDAAMMSEGSERAQKVMTRVLMPFTPCPLRSMFMLPISPVYHISIAIRAWDH